MAHRILASLARSRQLIADRDRFRAAPVRGRDGDEPLSAPAGPIGDTNTAEAEEARGVVARARLQTWHENTAAVEETGADGACDAVVRERLLQWEADDLAACVPDEISLPRRQFALHLYETIRYANAMGMDMDRLLYHVQNARMRIESEQ